MLSISIKHPDAEKFIDIKTDTEKVTGANVSVKLIDEFMEAVFNDDDFIQTFPIDLDINTHTAFMEELNEGLIKYDVLYPLQYEGSNEFKGCYAKRTKARKLWDKIVKNAWKSAEPGALFWDTILKESPANAYGKDWEETSTNPCGYLN